PLPVRGAHAERANPAEAVPGIRPDDRDAVATNATTPPVPRGGAVRGTMGKPPQLPRRRAQEHIAPQLRDGPAPRQDSEHPAGHDPGLMAAFQRGIGLAEARQHMEAAETSEGADMASPHVEVPHMEPAHTEASHTEFLHSNGVHTGGVYTSPSHMGPDHTGSDTSAGTGTSPALSAAVNGTDHFLLAPHMDAAPIAEAHAHAPGHDLTARHDGSASAG
ncbi:ATP-binding protein, partial [Streptomyces sp. W16]|nr:ATP-binding protein [Streptomyces sp. W16]